MEGINLSAFFVGAASMYFIMCAVFMLSRKMRTRYQTILGWIFVAWALSNLKDIVITFPTFYTKQVQNYILIADGWMAITYTIFIFELVMPGWTTWKRLFFLCIPWGIFTLLYIAWPSDMVLCSYVAFLWFYAWTIVAIVTVKVRRYTRYIRSNYSNIDNKDISWLSKMIWFCIISELAWLYVSLNYNVYSDALYYISTIVMWQVVIHYSYHFRPVVVQEQDIVKEGKHDYSFADKLDDIMEQKQLYLQADLTLEELAYQLRTNRTYMSEYFNQVKHMTFYDYINQLRITKKTLPLIQEHPEFTLEFIAAKSGFKSVSTFRRAFIKQMGTSPSKYRQAISSLDGDEPILLP